MQGTIFCLSQILHIFSKFEHWKEKWSHIDLKIWVTGGSKFDPIFRVIGEYLSQFDSILWVNSNWLSICSQFDSNIFQLLTNWLSLSSQFDSNIQQLLGIPGRIIVPPVTQIFRSKWLNFFFPWRRFLKPLLPLKKNRNATFTRRLVTKEFLDGLELPSLSLGCIGILFQEIHSSSFERPWRVC